MHLPTWTAARRDGAGAWLRLAATRRRRGAGLRLGAAALWLGMGMAARMPAAAPEAWGSAAPTSPATAAVVNPADEEQVLRGEQMSVARELHARHPGGDAMFVLAMVCNEQGDVTGAIRHWEEGLRLPPESVRLHDRAEVWMELGESLRIQEQFERAESALRESLRLQPRREITCRRLAQLFYSLNRTEECLGVLDNGQARSAPALALRGKACQRLGRFEEARGHFEAALKVDPDSAEACYGLSAVCARLGADAEAAEYQRCFVRIKAAQQTAGRQFRASLNPLHTTRQSMAMTHTTAGWVYRDRREPDRAVELWRRAAEVDPANTACRFQLLMFHQQAGRNDEAFRICQEMIGVEPNNPFHHISLGNLEVRRGHPEMAARAFERAQELAPGRAETCFALAQFYLRTGTNLSEAARLAAKAVGISPVAPHYFLQSRVTARLGHHEAARQAMVRACELDPGNAEYAAWRRTLEMGRQESGHAH